MAHTQTPEQVDFETPARTLQDLVSPFVEITSGAHWSIKPDDFEALRTYYEAAEHPDFDMANPFDYPFDITIPLEPMHRIRDAVGQVSALPFSLALRVHDSLAPFKRQIKDDDVDQTLEAFRKAQPNPFEGRIKEEDREEFIRGRQESVIVNALLLAIVRKRWAGRADEALEYVTSRDLLSRKSGRLVRTVLKNSVHYL